MDKASAYGAGDCRFESCRGHVSSFARARFCDVRRSVLLKRSNIILFAIVRVANIRAASKKMRPE